MERHECRGASASCQQEYRALCPQPRRGAPRLRTEPPTGEPGTGGVRGASGHKAEPETAPQSQVCPRLVLRQRCGEPKEGLHRLGERGQGDPGGDARESVSRRRSPRAAAARPPGRDGGTPAVHPGSARRGGPATPRPASARGRCRSARHRRWCDGGRGCKHTTPVCELACRILRRTGCHLAFPGNRCTPQRSPCSGGWSA